MEKYTPVNNIFLLFIRDRLHNRRDLCLKSTSAANRFIPSLLQRQGRAGQGWEAMLHLEETTERGSWSFSGVAGTGWNNVLLLSQKVALTLKVLVQKGLKMLKYFYIA